MAEISVKLTDPADVVLEVLTPRVQLPAVAGDITILPSRAPLDLILREGELRLMDEKSQVTARYSVKGGIAHIAADHCLIATEEVHQI